MIHVAAILARGLGSRMRRDDGSATLDANQSRQADAGVKGMIPIGRPFLDYVLSALADAGMREVVFVIAPGHNIIRGYYSITAPPSRVSVRYAVQDEPLGTADAVIAAAREIGDAPFLVLNADNYYPADAVRALAELDDAGVVAFDRNALLADGAINADRIRQYAVLSLRPDDILQRIIEKPGDTIDPLSEEARWVSMNLWAITPPIVDACRNVQRSSRGEYELPMAVGSVLDTVCVRVVRRADRVLDLSERRDIAAVAERLRDVVVQP